MVAKYKLSMVEIEQDEKGKDKYPSCFCKCQHNICDIGTFKDEEALIKWAQENKGELAKC